MVLEITFLHKRLKGRGELAEIAHLKKIQVFLFFFIYEKIGGANKSFQVFGSDMIPNVANNFGSFRKCIFPAYPKRAFLK